MTTLWPTILPESPRKPMTNIPENLDLLTWNHPPSLTSPGKLLRELFLSGTHLEGWWEILFCPIACSKYLFKILKKNFNVKSLKINTQFNKLKVILPLYVIHLWLLLAGGFSELYQSNIYWAKIIQGLRTTDLF